MKRKGKKGKRGSERRPWLQASGSSSFLLVEEKKGKGQKKHRALPPSKRRRGRGNRAKQTATGFLVTIFSRGRKSGFCRSSFRGETLPLFRKERGLKRAIKQGTFLEKGRLPRKILFQKGEGGGGRRRKRRSIHARAAHHITRSSRKKRGERRGGGGQSNTAGTPSASRLYLQKKKKKKKRKVRGTRTGCWSS